MSLDDQQRAQKSAEAMWANDSASRDIGMRIESVAPGEATLSMEVEKRHTNGHAICHGGFIFALADSAFAFACNSYNKSTVAQHCMISFLAPGKLGDQLTAHAKEVHLAGRSGIYDIAVTNQDGMKIAEFRGMSRTISGTLFEEENA
ncbi:hydroxyphenylacetyl-CoA thioesterase PaaI [Salaquimonas pukyongi]|uniref:hydroxyphenylacetyl-CoA thioesterase PaaI n=1 Tax=Salaquimonas pukyongi TaxID=2712698 RepID=UPI00096B93CD|nr:hydroxyphenylacetyl-CoA thioesterase PaaI [Salaquimonas pukyongi]